MPHPNELPHLKDKSYLGDGVYVGHDGYYVVLFLLEEGACGRDAIGLEPGVIDALNRYISRIFKKEEK